MTDWEVHEFTEEEKAALVLEFARLKLVHPFPCELFTTTTGKCTCGNYDRWYEVEDSERFDD